MSSRELELILIVLLIVAVIALAVFALLRRKRGGSRRGLKERFGPEYERLVAYYGNPQRAERELQMRERRVRRLPLKQLSAAQSVSFAELWKQAQERFVDTPSIAVRSAQDLVEQVVQALGYPKVDFTQRAADLSVNYSGVVDHYRNAHVLLHEQDPRSPRDDTETLRQAMVHYRALFDELVGGLQGRALKAPRLVPRNQKEARV